MKALVIIVKGYIDVALNQKSENKIMSFIGKLNGKDFVFGWYDKNSYCATRVF